MSKSMVVVPARRIELGPTAITTAALLALMLALPAFGYAPLLINATDTLILILLVLSLNLLVGYGGMISMGHAAFYAAGGYTAGILAKYFSIPIVLAFPAGAAMAALLAAVIGFFSIRLTHAYFIMLTLAFAQLVYTVIWKWSSVTGGDDGLIGFGPPHILEGTVAYYYFTLVVVGYAFMRSGASAGLPSATPLRRSATIRIEQHSSASMCGPYSWPPLCWRAHSRASRAAFRPISTAACS